jgi:hypothetical protein
MRDPLEREVKMLKRFSIVLALAVALSLVFVGGAYANFGPHGGYNTDTDACAACHRAHTSFSPVGFKDGLGVSHPSALLVGSAQTMTQFCYACHGDNAPGASTNVASGVFDSGPSASSSQTVPGTSDTNGAYTGPGTSGGTGGGTTPLLYKTASVFNAPLNGGGFNQMPDPYKWEASATILYKATTSTHKMETPQVLWGSGNAVTDAGVSSFTLQCTDCHDPHGTSNYRLLRGNINGQSVGGYQTDGSTPNAYVFSMETSYPVPVGMDGVGGKADPANPGGGWLKHTDGAAQMAAYRPNYTDTSGTVLLHTDGNNIAVKSLSVWCAACHQQYNKPASSYDYGTYEPVGGYLGNYVDTTPTPGAQMRHRHPVDITLAAGTNGTLTEKVSQDTTWVPLEHAPNGSGDFTSDYLGCLTCHRAHGSSTEMTGWASAHLTLNATNTPTEVNGVWMPTIDNTGGVDPIKSTSALLRADNRGVCERCHNK